MKYRWMNEWKKNTCKVTVNELKWQNTTYAMTISKEKKIIS